MSNEENIEEATLKAEREKANKRIDDTVEAKVKEKTGAFEAKLTELSEKSVLSSKDTEDLKTVFAKEQENSKEQIKDLSAKVANLEKGSTFGGNNSSPLSPMKAFYGEFMPVWLDNVNGIENGSLEASQAYVKLQKFSKELDKKLGYEKSADFYSSTGTAILPASIGETITEKIIDNTDLLKMSKRAVTNKKDSHKEYLYPMIKNDMTVLFPEAEGFKRGDLFTDLNFDYMSLTTRQMVSGFTIPLQDEKYSPIQTKSIGDGLTKDRFNKTIENILINGGGDPKGQGIGLKTQATPVLSKVAGVFSYEDFTAMRAAIDVRSWENTTWIMSGITWQNVLNMKDGSGAYMFYRATNINESKRLESGYLLGIKVTIVSEDILPSAVTGGSNPIILADMSKMVYATGPFTMKRLNKDTIDEFITGSAYWATEIYFTCNPVPNDMARAFSMIEMI